MNKQAQRKIGKYANRLKKHPTKTELILLKELQKTNIRFKFQKYFLTKTSGFIADFYFPGRGKKKLIVELDGKSHEYQREYDKARTKWLEENRNCEVVRFKNEEILNNVYGIIEKLRNMGVDTFEARQRRKEESKNNFIENKPKRKFKKYVEYWEKKCKRKFSINEKESLEKEYLHNKRYIPKINVQG